MDKHYISKVILRKALPRNPRLREQGSGTSSTSVTATSDGRYEELRRYLDSLFVAHYGTQEGETTPVLQSIEAKAAFWTLYSISAGGKGQGGGGEGGATALSELSDVTLTAQLSAGQALIHNGIKWQNADLSTSNIIEGTNLFYTDERVQARIESVVNDWALKASGKIEYDESEGRFVFNHPIYGRGGQAPQYDNEDTSHQWLSEAKDGHQCWKSAIQGLDGTYTYIKVTMPSAGTIYIRSEAESTFDYAYVTATKPTSITPTSPIAATSGKQSQWVSASVDAGVYYVGYLKDTSESVTPDCAWTYAETPSSGVKRYLMEGEGSSSLAGLDDVSMSTAVNGDVLIYDNESGKWKNVPQSELVPDLSSYATKSWVQGLGYITGITKAMVEGVLTGTITSHSHDLSSYATKSWVQGLGYITGITKAMVEGVLTGTITSHSHDLSSYATKPWVQGLGYITGITKAMVEDVLTGTITSHNHNGTYLMLTGGTVSGDLTVSGALTSPRWYPIVGNTSKYIEYDFTNDAFKVCGNIYATGNVSAGGSGSGGYGIDDLSDVDLTEPAIGQSLKYDGERWVNADMSGIETYTDAQVLQYATVGTNKYSASLIDKPNGLYRVNFPERYSSERTGYMQLNFPKICYVSYDMGTLAVDIERDLSVSSSTNYIRFYDVSLPLFVLKIGNMVMIREYDPAMYSVFVNRNDS